jgi:hypothetical protein
MLRAIRSPGKMFFLTLDRRLRTVTVELEPRVVKHKASISKAVKKSFDVGKLTPGGKEWLGCNDMRSAIPGR